ncbi:hypothetical protein BH11PSE9_BH11PSE9_13580 [soil metagenome]
MIELLIEVFGEFILQCFAEVLVEFGLHWVAEPFRRRPSPWIAALGYALFGAILGGLSLLVFPSNFATRPWRLLNLIVTPLAVGGAMATLGAWRARRAEDLWRIDRFGFGYVFALSLALVRYVYAA